MRPGGFWLAASASLLLAIARPAAAEDAAPTPTPTPAPSTSPTIAREEASANAKSPAGRRYEGAVIGRTEVWLRPVLEQCAARAATEDRISFDALIRIGGDGRAEEVLLVPGTSVGRCVAPGFRDAAYPRPPKPAWWVQVEVRLK